MSFCEIPFGEVMLNIWFELVAWLRGRYDSIQGESDEAERENIVGKNALIIEPCWESSSTWSNVWTHLESE